MAANKPVKSNAKNKKMMVLATKTINGERRVKLIHFGALGYGHNNSIKAIKANIVETRMAFLITSLTLLYFFAP